MVNKMATIDVAVALESLKNTSEQNANELKDLKLALNQLVSIAVRQAEMSQQMIGISEKQSDYQERTAGYQVRTDKKIDDLVIDVKSNTRTNYMWIGAGSALSVASIAIAIYVNLGKILGS